jgi:hypothetical protein
MIRIFFLDSDFLDVIIKKRKEKKRKSREIKSIDGKEAEQIKGQCANKHIILVRYYLRNIFLVSCHSSVTLYLPNVLDMKTFLLSLCHIYLFILHPNFISARSFFFPLCVLYIRHRSVLDECDWRME